jgi:hypothetical protein
MEEKLKKVIKLIKKSGSQEDLSLEQEMVGLLLSLLDDAGFKALIILEKPGRGVSMVGRGISEGGVSIPLAELFTDYPELLRSVITKMAIMKVFGAEQEENNTPPPEATIH